MDEHAIDPLDADVQTPYAIAPDAFFDLFLLGWGCVTVIATIANVRKKLRA